MACPCSCSNAVTNCRLCSKLSFSWKIKSQTLTVRENRNLDQHVLFPWCRNLPPFLAQLCRPLWGTLLPSHWHLYGLDYRQQWNNTGVLLSQGTAKRQLELFAWTWKAMTKVWIQNVPFLVEKLYSCEDWRGQWGLDFASSNCSTTSEEQNNHDVAESKLNLPKTQSKKIIYCVRMISQTICFFQQFERGRAECLWGNENSQNQCKHVSIFRWSCFPLWNPISWNHRRPANLLAACPTTLEHNQLPSRTRRLKCCLSTGNRSADERCIFQPSVERKETKTASVRLLKWERKIPTPMGVHFFQISDNLYSFPIVTKNKPNQMKFINLINVSLSWQILSGIASDR